MTGVVQPAMAQSNATGTIYGVVTPGPDVKVHIENPQTGVRRTLIPDAAGRFQATSLPTGSYKLTLAKGDAVIGTADAEASLGKSTEVVFPEAASSIQTVQVSGQRRTIDVSNSPSGASFTAKQLEALPIARNIEAIIQLAPNTTRADSRFAGGASFAGGAASENSYYINGFPVVNPLTGLGASQLPFGAIAEAQVLTGSYGAEFGRSTGGVVNVISKSGTNTWEAGVMTSFEPQNLRANPKNFNFGNTGKNPATDNTLRQVRNKNTSEEQITSVYVGGPIIKDKLFIFAAAEEGDLDESLVNLFRTSTSLTQNAWRDRQTRTQRYLLKVDYNITDNHRLEFTAFGDTPKQMIQDSGMVGTGPLGANGLPTVTAADYANANRNNIVTSRASRTNVDSNGGKTAMLKYTGNLTQDLTLTGLWGQTVSQHINEFPGYDINQVLFSTTALPANQAPGVNYANPQQQSGNLLAPGSKDDVKNYRVDLEWQLGKHTLRGGLDHSKIASINAGEFKAGGGTWEYLKTANPTKAFDVTGGTVPAIAGFGALAAQGYYVRKGLFTDVTDSFGEQSAQYLEDKFQITQNVLITGGLRREGFKNINDSGVTFLDMKAAYSPRLGIAWDANGDASLKIFGSGGRFTVPIPTHIAVRGAGRSTNTDQYYTYSGVNPDGSPILGTQLTSVLSGNNEFGQAKDVKTLAALDMKPSYQDEIVVGFEKAWSPSLNFGAKATYKKLKSTIDDFCDVRPFETYAAAHNIDITNPLWGNTCQTFNPGRDNTFYIDYAGGGKNDVLVHLTKEQLGFPEDPTRTYAALDFFLEHPLRNGWYGKVNYTLSKNKGNTEGQVRSDNAQADVSATAVWDYPELMVGANGLLPNDRKHQLKAFGFYQFNKEFTVGGNFLAASGRPRSCIGSAPNPGDSPNYSNQAFYCYGADRSQNVPTPRGTLGRLPFDTRLDMNVAYTPQALKGFAFKIDVFNVFNHQVIQNVTEAYNSGTAVSSTYESPLSATAPRSAKFTVQYDHKFN